MSKGYLKMDNFTSAADPARLVERSLVPFGCTDDGALILADASKREIAAVIPVGPDLFIRCYSDTSERPDAPYLSYVLGTKNEIVEDVRQFSDLKVIQGLEIVLDFGISDEDGNMLPEEEGDVDLAKTNPLLS